MTPHITGAQSEVVTLVAGDARRFMRLFSRVRQLRARFSGEILFVLATLSQPAVNIIGGFIAARYLTPVELGTINSAALLPAYLGFLHLGVFTGVSRNLPLALGAGDLEHAKRAERTSSGVATYAGIVGGLVCLLAAVGVAVRQHDRLLFWAMLATAVSSSVGPVTNHIDVMLRAKMRFFGSACVQFLTNGFMLVSNGLVIIGGIVGAISRIALGGVLALLTRLPLREWQPVERADWGEARSLARIGLPLLLSSTLFSFLMVADRTVVMLRLGKEELGYFALAGMIVNSIQFIPQSFALILFPRMAREYGRTGDPRSLRRLVLLNLGLNIAVIVPVCGFLYFTVDSLVRQFFPAYLPGVAAAKVACLTGIFWIYLGVGSVFGVLNRMRAYLSCMVISILTVWTVGTFAIAHGHGILGAAYARLVATALLCVFTLAYSWMLVTQAPDRAAEA